MIVPEVTTTEIIICKRCDSKDDYRTEKAGPHIKAVCNKCGRYIKFISQGSPKVMPFGKFKGRPIHTITKPHDLKYLRWFLGNILNIPKATVEDITVHLKKYSRK